jgi:23S rRNA (adenine2030-N6)-methyltransferase
VIPRTEAHDLPKKLRTMATQTQRPWLNATLAIGHGPLQPNERPGLTASGMFVINPPHTLKAALAATLPVLLSVLGRGRGQAESVESGG